jgi:hypothetical protein
MIEYVVCIPAPGTGNHITRQKVSVGYKPVNAEPVALMQHQVYQQCQKKPQVFLFKEQFFDDILIAYPCRYHGGKVIKKILGQMFKQTWFMRHRLVNIIFYAAQHREKYEVNDKEDHLKPVVSVPEIIIL